MLNNVEQLCSFVSCFLSHTLQLMPYGLGTGRKQADDGYLYPLEKAFFYIHKPPTLLVHDEIESIEFMRQGGGVLAASAKTFDLNIRMKTDTKQVHALL